MWQKNVSTAAAAGSLLASCSPLLAPPTPPSSPAPASISPWPTAMFSRASLAAPIRASTPPARLSSFKAFGAFSSSSAAYLIHLPIPSFSSVGFSMPQALTASSSSAAKSRMPRAPTESRATLTFHGFSSSSPSSTSPSPSTTTSPTTTPPLPQANMPSSTPPSAQPSSSSALPSTSSTAQSDRSGVIWLPNQHCWKPIAGNAGRSSH